MSRQRLKRERGRKPESAGYKPRKLVPRSQNQRSYMRAIRDSDIVLCHGPAGSGKALPLDCSVLTSSGHVLMDSIQRGDIISTPAGVTEVTEVYPQGVKSMKTFMFSDRTQVKSSSDHLWTLVNMDSGQLCTKTTSEFAKCVNTPAGKSKWCLPSIQPVQFDDTELIADPYVLGLLLGDGSFRQGTAVWFSTADRELLHAMPWECRPKGQYDYRLCKGNAEISAYMLVKSLKLNNRKSEDKFIPPEFLYASIKNRIHLLRGLMDTDGSIYNGTSEFSSSSKQLAKDVQFLVQSLGGKATLSSRTTKCLDNFRVIMSIQICPFKLKRKANRWKPPEKYLPKRILRDVKNSDACNCQCIKVDAEDGLFLIEGCIPTHNTHIAAGVAVQMMKTSHVEKIIICRPVIGVGKDIGYLPGSMEDKIGPYLVPLFDEFSYYCENSLLRNWASEGKLEIVPLSMMRGRTFNDSFVILDEAQNASMIELRMVLTRIGANSKIVVSGDLHQSDLLENQAGAFNQVVGALDGLDGVSVVALTSGDIVRHRLIGAIESRLTNLSEN